MLADAFFLEDALRKKLCGCVCAFDSILVCAAVTLFHQRKIKKVTTFSEGKQPTHVRRKKIDIPAFEKKKTLFFKRVPPDLSSFHLGTLSGCVYFSHIIPPFLWRDESYSGDLIAVV